jgi:uncharacterized LabA/DUF88 family protein
MGVTGLPVLQAGPAGGSSPRQHIEESNLSEERLKIAVFIDFDNIEIGVKKTLNRHFDVGTVLEAIKERGEVVTKIAYGDWKHASDYSRAMTQHAVQMVQRNLTPGGDKNGADITLALDALEMAFTRSHINAFVIVGGDSDFIALVEKLKQYDKTVYVVGGRSFTSSILQKNCHEFIAYENLIGLQPAARKSAGRTPATATAQLRDALPPLRRALEILADREVSPQLGLLKSTLLQLDSTFSERDYGAHSFREFIQKMANAGFVHLKQVDRSLLVELKYGDGTQPAAPANAVTLQEAEPEASQASPPNGTPTPSPVVGAISFVRRLFEQAGSTPHWPMYLRGFKSFLRSSDPAFDERRLGFTGIHDLVRQAQREGLLRIERNRQGILRIYPGELFPQPAPDKPESEPVPAAAESAMPEVQTSRADVQPPPDTPIVEAAPVLDEPPAEPAPAAPEEAKPRRKKAAKGTATTRKKTTAKKPRSAKKPAAEK